MRTVISTLYILCNAICQVRGFLWVFQFPALRKLTATEILLFKKYVYRICSAMDKDWSARNQNNVIIKHLVLKDSFEINKGLTVTKLRTLQFLAAQSILN
jgi:hypothetical protein